MAGESKIEIQVEKDKLQELFVGTFLKSLTAEAAQQMLEKGIVHVLEANYQVKNMLEGLAVQVIAEQLHSPESPFRARMHELVDQAFERVFSPGSKESSELVHNMATALVYGLTKGGRF